jgi:hypothetical protein
VIGVAAVILLAAFSQTSNLSRIANPHLMAELEQHRFEPVRVSTGFDADDHLAARLRLERADIIGCTA